MVVAGGGKLAGGREGGGRGVREEMRRETRGKTRGETRGQRVGFSSVRARRVAARPTQPNHEINPTALTPLPKKPNLFHFHATSGPAADREELGLCLWDIQGDGVVE